MVLSFNFLGARVKISFLLIALLALFAFCDKSGLMLVAISSALIHELGHIVMAELLGFGVKELYFAPFGIRMILKTPLSVAKSTKKIAVLSAGCFVNLVLFIVFWFLGHKTAAYIQLITATFNILPAGTLDGGRILHEILTMHLEADRAQTITDIISLLSAVLLFLLGSFVLLKSGYNFSLILTSIYLAIMVIIRQKKLN